MAKRPNTGGKGRAEEAPRAGGVRSLADMLPAVGGVAFRKFGFVQSSVVSRWSEIVGERYAGISQPEMIRFPTGRRSGGTLVLGVEGAHAPMMQHVAPAILDRVNMFFGYAAVERVTIRQGALARAAPPSLRAPPSSLRAVPQDLGDSLRAIADPELRECLSALAGAVAASEGPPRIDGGRN